MNIYNLFVNAELVDGVDGNIANRLIFLLYQCILLELAFAKNIYQARCHQKPSDFTYIFDWSQIEIEDIHSDQSTTKAKDEWQ